MFVNHLDSKTKYTDLFAASCGSIGDFTDIKLSDEGYAMTRQMKHFNLPVRNLDGTFYAQVHPFDPSYFAVVLLFLFGSETSAGMVLSFVSPFHLHNGLRPN